MQTDFKLFENPNAIISGDIRVLFEDGYTFGYFKIPFEDKPIFLIGKRLTHDALVSNNRDKLHGFLDYGGGRDLMYCGRFWIEEKIISFWRFPEDNKIMKKIVEDIQKYLNDNKFKDDVWNNWKVEILIDEDAKDDSKAFGGWVSSNTEIIPVKDYKGSEERSEGEIKLQHIIPPSLKTGKVKDRFPGWKPKKFPGQLPGEVEVAARARIYQEKLITKFKLFEHPDSVYSNEKSILVPLKEVRMK